MNSGSFFGLFGSKAGLANGGSLLENLGSLHGFCDAPAEEHKPKSNLDSLSAALQDLPVQQGPFKASLFTAPRAPSARGPSGPEPSAAPTRASTGAGAASASASAASGLATAQAPGKVATFRDVTTVRVREARDRGGDYSLASSLGNMPGPPGAGAGANQGNNKGFYGVNGHVRVSTAPPGGAAPSDKENRPQGEGSPAPAPALDTILGGLRRTPPAEPLFSAPTPPLDHSLYERVTFYTATAPVAPEAPAAHPSPPPQAWSALHSGAAQQRAMLDALTFAARGRCPIPDAAPSSAAPTPRPTSSSAAAPTPWTSAQVQGALRSHVYPAGPRYTPRQIQVLTTMPDAPSAALAPALAAATHADAPTPPPPTLAYSLGSPFLRERLHGFVRALNSCYQLFAEGSIPGFYLLPPPGCSTPGAVLFFRLPDPQGTPAAAYSRPSRPFLQLLAREGGNGAFSAPLSPEPFYSAALRQAALLTMDECGALQWLGTTSKPRPRDPGPRGSGLVFVGLAETDFLVEKMLLGWPLAFGAAKDPCDVPGVLSPCTFEGAALDSLTLRAHTLMTAAAKGGADAGWSFKCELAASPGGTPVAPWNVAGLAMALMGAAPSGFAATLAPLTDQSAANINELYWAAAGRMIERISSQPDPPPPAKRRRVAGGDRDSDDEGAGTGRGDGWGGRPSGAAAAPWSAPDPSTWPSWMPTWQAELVARAGGPEGGGRVHAQATVALAGRNVRSLAWKPSVKGAAGGADGPFSVDAAPLGTFKSRKMESHGSGAPHADSVRPRPPLGPLHVAAAAPADAPHGGGTGPINKTVIQMTPQLYDYVLARTSESPVLAELRSETCDKVPSGKQMQISPEQGAFMANLVRLMGAKRCIEIGTFTGYSALAVAQALPADGKLVALDIDEKTMDMARSFWAKAGVSDRVEGRVGPGADALRALLAEGGEGKYDFAFIDADKRGYDQYYELCLQLVRPGGVVALDNMLWYGRVADPTVSDKNTAAIRALNDKVAGDPRVHSSIVPIGDGVVLAVKK